MSEDQAENGEGDPRVEDPATRYIQYWEYLRHIERLRFQLASVVVVVTVVALGFVSDPNNVRHDDNRKWVLVGLAAFVFAALMYLVQHKASYRKYFNLVNALDPEDLINGGGLAPGNLAAVYLSVDVKTDEDFDDLPGFEITAEAALSEASQWVYLRPGDISPKLLEEQPMVGVLLSMTRDGLLLDLEGTLEKDGLFGKHGLDLGLGGGPGPDQDQREITVGVSSKKRGGAHRDADRGEDDEEGIAKKLLADFLAGRAGADQIQELVEMIEDDDVDVNVTRTGDGLYVLRATGFDDDDMLENGVPDFDEDLLSIERFENDGKTRVFKVSDFTSLLESLMGAADEDK